MFFVSADNTLHALNGGDGTELWTARGLPQVATLLSNVSPAVSAGVVVAPFPAGDVAAYDVTSGKAAGRIRCRARPRPPLPAFSAIRRAR